MKKLLISIAFLLALFLVVSCADKVKDEDTQSSEDTSVSESAAPEGIKIADSDGTEYVIVCPAGQDYLREICAQIRSSIFNATYKNVFVRSDSDEPRECEIIIGSSVNRAELKAVAKDLAENEYRITWVGKKLVVAGGTNHAAWQGANVLLSEYFNGLKEGAVYLPSDIDIKGKAGDLMDFENFTFGWGTYKYEKDNVVLSFAMYVPQNYSKDKSYPLLLNLHGDGNIGKDVMTVLANGEITFGRRAAAEYKDTVVIVPASTETWMQVARDTTDNIYKNFSFDSAIPSKELEAAVSLVDECAEKMAIDKSRIYLSGYSKGCMSSWYIMAKHSDKFAAAAIACGSGDPSAVSKFSHIPVWVFMGDADTVVSYPEVKGMYDAYTAAGGKGRFTVCTGAGHGIANWLQNEKELITWLYSQKKAN